MSVACNSCVTSITGNLCSIFIAGNYLCEIFADNDCRGILCELFFTFVNLRIFQSEVYTSINKVCKPKFCADTQLICRRLNFMSVYFSKRFNLCKLRNFAITVYKWIIFQYIKWIFAIVHYTCFTYFISVFFIGSIFLVLLIFADHTFFKGFVACTHIFCPPLFLIK